jgi:hypothetical protein
MMLTNDMSTLGSIVNAGGNHAHHLDAYGSNALHQSSRNGELDKTIFLIKLGIEIDSHGECGW